MNPRPGAGAPPGRGGAVASPPPGLDGRLDAVETAIEQFRIEAERYFNGGQPVPPEEARQHIERLLRELRATQVRAAAEQFRMAGLEARFNSISELFGRRLRAREEGRSAIAPKSAPPGAPRHDARAGIVFRGQPEAAAVEALWISLASGPDGARLELESFRGYFARQVEEIRAKTGAAAVQFRVVEEAGKLKLKAKPVAGGDK